MSQRMALLITVALTVFVMVMMGGVMWQVIQKSTLSTMALQQNAPAVLPQATAVPAIDQTAQTQIAEREAGFQQLIEQANQRLAEANKKQEELAKQLAEQKATAQTRSSAQPKYKVLPEQATAIALQAVPGAVLLRPPELVDFKGVPAFEVTLDLGTVYIDANTGEILYNSADAVVVHRPGSGGGGGNVNNANSNTNSGGHKEEHEHEDEHGDD